MGVLPADRQRRLQELPGWTWDPKSDQWEVSYARLRDYVETHSDTPIPASRVVDGFPLGRWIIKQRARRSEGNLPIDRQHRLESLPGWTWDTYAGKWEEGLDELRRYAEHFGHTRVPASYTIDGYRLGQWVTIQRQNQAKGALDDDRQKQLQNVPNWTWDPIADLWEEGFNQLRKYVAHQGNARVPQSYVLDGYRLGTWINTQRANYREGKLTVDRQQLLESMPGWTWDPRANKWEDGFIRLLRYVEDKGNSLVPQSYKDDDYPLGAWVATQRTAYRDGVLGPDRQRRLEELPSWTWAFVDNLWEEGFRHLSRYVDSHGDARVPRNYTVDGYNLGQWVVGQRQRRAKGSLEADRQCRLDQTPGWSWDPFAEQWEEGFRALLRYVDSHGHARVPKSAVHGNYPLGTWTTKQRTTYSRGTIDADRCRRLEDVPGWTWDPFAAQWEAAFAAIQHYADGHGHARVPSSYTTDGLQLGRWVVTQRRNHTKGTLDPDREQRLASLPGWTWNTRG